jgi:hypothetical protein
MLNQSMEELDDGPVLSVPAMSEVNDIHSTVLVWRKFIE